MTDNRDFPAHATFSQRYGYEPLPEPMRLEEISDDLRREIWNGVYSYISSLDLYGVTEKRIQVALGRYHSEPESRINTSNKMAVALDMENTILYHDFNKVLDFLEIVIEEKVIPNYLRLEIGGLFEKYGAAYRLDFSSTPYRFIPSASKEQSESTQHALQILHEGNMVGATTHLRQAAEHINARQYADAITDCIHAVESVARIIDPKSSTTLKPALNSLEKANVLNHPVLKQAFLKLYGYTSDEQGLRHALLDQNTADVGLSEAVFMFGACASFAAYLAQKHQQTDGA